MSITDIPRTVVRTYVKVLRWPIDQVVGKNGSAAPVVDQAEGKIKAAVGDAIGDEALVTEGKRKTTAGTERARAQQLKIDADAKREEAQSEAEQKRRQAEQKRQQAAKQAEQRRKKAAEDKQQAKAKVERTAAQRKNASAKVENTRKTTAQDAGREDKLEAAEARAEALEAKTEALTAADEAARLQDAAARVKAERKANSGS